jgi:hypothetical protein
MLPFHHFIFEQMVQRIVAAAEEREAARVG